MERRLRDRVAASRRRSFVGRVAELELFSSGLDGAGFAVLFVQGPGGAGKSALLRMFAERAADAGLPVARIDGHDVRPHPAAFLAAAGVAGRTVVLVDTYELLEPLDDWLREDFVPGLADGSLVVIAGRRPPPPGWRSDPGWRDLVRVLRLGNLDQADATRYLAEAGVSPALCASTAAAVHGHPLALAVAVDVLAQRGDEALSASVLDDPDALAVLVSRLLDGVPDEQHRTVLAVCALARFTTEPLLRAVLGIDDARSVFDWLRDLSCVEAGPLGLYPHDLARDVLDADLRWRDGVRHRELEGRILAHVRQRIGTETGRARQEAIFDLFFSVRTDPVAGRFWTWETFGSVYPEQVGTVGRDAVLNLVAAHEGPESAAIAMRWLDRQPEAFTIYRERGELRGLVVWLTLAAPAGTEAPADPVVAAAWRHAERHGPLRPGEEMIVKRFLVDRDAYQRPSPGVDLASLIHVELSVARPRLAWAVIVVADPDFWAPFFATIGHFRAPGVSPSVGGRSYALFVRDARQPSPVDEALPRHGFAGPALSREACAAAVRDALRDLGRADLLARSPLLTLRAVRERGGGPAALQSVLADAADVLRGHPRDEKLYRAVDRTYLRPAPTQERAAELLGLPFSTYRRHRRTGVARIVAVLWDAETGPDGD